MSNIYFSSAYLNSISEQRIAEEEVKWADEQREASQLLKEFSIPDIDMEALYRRRRRA